jgi:acetyl-CoA carboxylase carboxyl transferase subunit alpha
MAQVPSFERPVTYLLDRIRELRNLVGSDPHTAPEFGRLEENVSDLAREVYSGLTPIERVAISRQAGRPYTLDYIQNICTDFIELSGDRLFGNDAAIVAGLARYRNVSVLVIGHQKGRSTKDNVRRNFGMPNPEGYRKALRLYKLAERFRLPVLTFIDTPGAYPGIGAEERGQSEAIASCIEAMATLTVPSIATIIGEGGSGGALALGVANRVLMLEFAYYSVISPEGCASILWKDAQKVAEAATQLRLSAPELKELAVIDDIIAEPAGGAHCDKMAATQNVDGVIWKNLEELLKLSPTELREQRYARFRRLGAFNTTP